MQVDVGPLGLTPEEALARLSPQGVGLSMTVHPTILRAVTHLDVADQDIERADRADPAGAGSPCRRLSACRRLVLEAPARRAAAERQCRRLPGRASSPGARRSGSPTSSRASRRRRTRSTRRLDHEDVHRRRDHAAPRRGQARPRGPALEARPRGRARHADAAPDARARLGPAARAARRRSGRRSASRDERAAGGLEEAEQVLRAGERWHYSNLAYALLGRSSRGSRERPSATYVQERLLGPVGLERTTWGPGDGRGAAVLRRALLRRRRREPVLELRRQGRRVRRSRARPATSPAGARSSATRTSRSWPPRRWRRCTT